MCSNWALRSGCLEPSSALRLNWREKPSPMSSLRTLLGLTAWPIGQGLRQLVVALRHPKQRALRIAQGRRLDEALEGDQQRRIAVSQRLGAAALTTHPAVPRRRR